MQSTGHSKAEAESLEIAARKMLEIPRLPDGANGPMGRAVLDAIRADEAKLGKSAALRKWARCSTVANACALDTDPAEHRAASGLAAASLRHPDREEYRYPIGALAAALSDAAARAKCSAAELAKLDAAAAAAKPLPKDWEPTVAAETPREGEEVIK